MQKKEIYVKQRDAHFVKITLDGDMLKYFTGSGVYLSGDRYNTSLIDLYSKTRSVSSFYPPFSGTPIDTYRVLSNEEIEFRLPKDLPIGRYDVIFCNPAGYFKASNSKRFNFIGIVETAFDSLKVLTRINGEGLILSFDNSFIIK